MPSLPAVPLTPLKTCSLTCAVAACRTSRPALQLKTKIVKQRSLADEKERRKNLTKYIPDVVRVGGTEQRGRTFPTWVVREALACSGRNGSMS